MSSFLTPDLTLEAAIRAKGEQLFALMDQQPLPALFSKKALTPASWSGRCRIRLLKRSSFASSMSCLP